MIIDLELWRRENVTMQVVCDGSLNVIFRYKSNKSCRGIDTCGKMIFIGGVREGA